MMFKVVLAVALVGLALAIKFLPWYSIVALGVVLLAGGTALNRFAFRRLLMVPFRLKGAALKGAQAEVHGLVEAPLPPAGPTDLHHRQADGPQDDHSDRDLREERTDRRAEIARRRWRFLEVTIKPREPNGQGSLRWEPGGLLLVGPDARADDIAADLERTGPCMVAACEVHDGHAFRPYDGMSCDGPRRIRLHIGVLPEARQLQFRYYLELFGRVDL